MWVVHWGLPLRLPWRTGVCPCEARGGGGAVAWVAGAQAAPGTRGSWRLGQQEIECSRRGWQPGLASTLQYACLGTPLPDREAWRATVYRVTESDATEVTLHSDTRPLVRGRSAPGRVEREGGAAAWAVGTLAVRSAQGQDCLCRRSCGPGRGFFPASCSWRPEGLWPGFLHGSARSGT